MAKKSNAPFRIFTIGHSIRTLEKFVALLRAHQIGLLVDIRSIPRSRRNPQFNREALGALIALAAKTTTAVMCAEAVPWRCHRSLVGDALVARGIDVRDIFSRSAAKPHSLTPWARVRGDKISYPG